jgi:hypothetical protein
LSLPPEIPPSPNKIFKFLSAIIAGISAVFPGIIQFYNSIVRYKTSDVTLGRYHRILAFASGLLVFIVGSPMIVGIINAGYSSSVFNFIAYDSLFASTVLGALFLFSTVVGFFLEIQGVFTDHFIRGIVFIPATILFVVIIIAAVSFAATAIFGLFFALGSLASALKGVVR